MENTDILESVEGSVAFFHSAGVAADPITGRILASRQTTPIPVDSIPLEKLDAKKPQTVTRLVKLEKLGLVRSEKVKSEIGFCKKYFINERGRDTVSKSMRKESKLCS